MMISMHMLTAGLDASILRSAVSKNRLENIRGIMLLKRGVSVSPDHLYLGTAATCAEAIATGTFPQTVTFFSAGDSDALAGVDCSKVNLVVVDTDLIDLYNTIFLNYTRFGDWISLISTSDTSKDGFNTLFKNLATLSDFGFVLLDPKFHVTAQYLPPASPWAEIIAQGYIAEADIRGLFPAFLFEPEASPQSFALHGEFCCMYPIVKDFHRLGYLLVTKFTSDLQSDELIHILRLHIQRYLTPNHDDYVFRNIQFKMLFEDLMQSELNGLEDIGNRFKRLPNPPQKYMRLLVLQFENTAVPLDKVIARAEIAFPRCNITSYKGNIIVLFSAAAHLFTPKFNRQTLAELLEEYSAFAVLSNATSRMRGLYTIYIQCESMLRLVPTVRKNDAQRFFDFEQYSLYYLIDLCSQAIANHYGHDDLMYLVHPDVILLTRYDRANKTDLRDFFFHYIMNNCSIAGSARLLYLHRNTAKYRLDRIVELTGIDLNNNTLKIRLALSCLLMRYIEASQHRKILLDTYTEGDQFKNEV